MMHTPVSSGGKSQVGQKAESNVIKQQYSSLGFCVWVQCAHRGWQSSTAARVGRGGDQPTAGNTPPVPGLGGAAAAHSSQIPGKTSLLRGAFWFF